MKSTLIKSLLVGTTLTVGVTALTWNGGATLQNAMEKIGGLTSIVTRYQGNETKLKERVGILNKEVSDKTTQISNLDKEIERLKEELANSGNNNQGLLDQIAQLEALKTQLEGELATARKDLATAQDEVTRLEGELNKANTQISEANAQAEALRLELEKVDIGAFNPMSDEELNSLFNGEEVAPPTPPTDIPLTPLEPSTPIAPPTQEVITTNWNVTNGSISTDRVELTYTLNELGEYGNDEVSIKSITTQPSDQPMYITLNGNDGDKKSIFTNQIATFMANELNGSKIEIFDNNNQLVEVINIIE